MNTNSTHGMAASTLSEIGSLDQGTLVFLTVQKKGQQRGKKGSKKVYGDDEVSVLVWSGFSYEALVNRSIKKLEAMEGVYTTVLEAAEKKDPFVTLEHVCDAVAETRTSLHRTVSEPSGRVEDDADEKAPVFESLEVDGVKVRGSKVYVGEGNPDDPRAPKPGTIYVDGVKLGEVVVTPAVNGRWETNKKPKTVAKDVLRRMLPSGLYVRYALEPARVKAIKVGSEASAAAIEAGIAINPESIRSLFKIAP
jgi:hypothetical protein